MKFLLSYTRTIFWTVGVVTVLAGLSIFGSAAGRSAIGVIAALITGSVAVGTGTAACFAARALRKRGRFAKTLVAFASIYNLILFPLGTIAGAAGLCWCFSRKLRGLEPLAADFDFQSKKGDGTHRWMQGVVSVGSIVILLGSLEAARWWGERHGLPRNSPLNGLALLFLCEWISVFFHELGHAVAGWAVGMKLAAFSVGPLTARKKSGRWKFGFTLVSLIGLGGSVATVPLHLRGLRRRMAVEIAAGPVASFLTAVAAMAALSFLPGSAWVMWWKIPAVVAAMSAGAVIVNLVPFGSAGGYSDGALLAQLLFGGPFADMREAVKMIGTTTATPVRPRDLPPAVFSRAVTAAAGTSQAGILRMFEMICAVDRGDLDLARVRLDSVLEAFETPEKTGDPGVAVEIGFYLVYLDGHAGRAGQWLRDSETFAAKKKRRLTGDFDYWRTVAGVRLAEGRDAESETAWQTAKSLADRFPAVGLYAYERHLLARLPMRDWMHAAEASPGEAPLASAAAV